MAFTAPEYERYTGERASRPAWIPLMTLTIARGWKSSRWVRWITWVSLIMAFGMTVMFYVANSVVPEWRSLASDVGEKVGQTGWAIDREFYLGLLSFFVYPVLLPLSLAFGYELVAKDIESNAVESYFARPLTPISYLLGRTAAFTAFLLAATLVPLTVVWISDIATAPEGRYAELGNIPLGFALALTITSVALALFAQAVTTITRSAIWTNLSFVVLLFFGHILAMILFEITDQSGMLAISLLQDVYVLCAWSLGMADQLGDFSPSVGQAIGVIGGIIVFSFLFLLRGLRRRTLLG